MVLLLSDRYHVQEGTVHPSMNFVDLGDDEELI